MPESPPPVNETVLPRFLYGTAWKENKTQELVELALRQGFRGIDTANQRRHYHEAAVGLAVAAAIQSGRVVRDGLFLQTKFTFRNGQDHRLPYDPLAPIAVQVQQSFESSLQNLGTDRIDSYLLHGPSQRSGLASADWEAWRAMEALHDTGRVRMLGVSNVSLDQLERLCGEARVRPRFVQNRCYAVRGWDRAVRQFCAANAMVYQGFSLLTANPEVLAHPELKRIALLRVTTFGTFVREFSPPNPKKGGWPEIPPSDSASDPYCRNALSSFKNGHIAVTHTWGGENSRIKLHNVVTHSSAKCRGSSFCVRNSRYHHDVQPPSTSRFCPVM